MHRLGGGRGPLEYFYPYVIFFSFNNLALAEVMFSPAFVGVFVCPSVSWITPKVQHGFERHVLEGWGGGTMNNPLEFGGDPDHNPDSGIFLRIPISLSIKGPISCSFSGSYSI